MPERSIHDNNVYAYAILCEQRRIVLYTEFRNGSADEYTDVIFDDVTAHHLMDALSGNILFGIEQIDAGEIVRGWADLFAERRKYGWPEAIDYETPDELLKILCERGVLGFEIASSYGLHGWVLARAKEVRPRSSKAELTL